MDLEKMVAIKEELIVLKHNGQELVRIIEEAQKSEHETNERIMELEMKAHGMLSDYLAERGK